jgi:hypothetical protein
VFKKCNNRLKKIQKKKGERKAAAEKLRATRVKKSQVSSVVNNIISDAHDEDLLFESTDL